MLSEIAYDSFADDQLFFSKQTVTNQIKEFLVSNLNAPKHLDSEAVLDAIELQQGVLVERARDTYSFSHLTLQEYLTAKYIVDNQQVDWLVTHHLTDERWREVFLLVAGLMPGRTGADTLLLQMEKQAQVYIVEPTLQTLLQWADEATAGSESSIQPAAKRTAAIYLARNLALAYTHKLVRDIDFALARTRAIDFALTLNLNLDLALDRDRARTLERDLALALDLNRALDLDLALSRALALALTRALTHDLDLAFARELKKIEIFKFFDSDTLISTLEKMQQEFADGSTSQQVIKAFIKQFWQVWFNSLNFDPNIATISEEEASIFSNYLYANVLIVCCKEAAVRVSPNIWAGIEDRMLRVTD